MQKLMGIALIGQTELSDRLGSQSPELREVAQRCEVVQLAPLDNELEGYLAHKFARFNLKLSDVLAPDAQDAIRARFITMPRGGRPADARSMCYPLVVNNLVCRAMNAARPHGLALRGRTGDYILLRCAMSKKRFHPADPLVAVCRCQGGK